MMRWRALAAVLVLALPGSLPLALPGTLPLPGALPLAAQQQTDRIVILARHAEKLGGEDPALSEAGEERARALAHVLSQWPVDAIYTSQFRRTRDTAAPLAEATGVAPLVVDARDMAALLSEIHEGGHRAILVIGHSNTVPAIARALGAPDVQDIPEEGYDDLLVVTLSGEGEATLLHLKYGAPTPY
ncbi:MAG: phosphoglycerate mutase family protein [Gemmatimonadota bacterium]